MTHSEDSLSARARAAHDKTALDLGWSALVDRIASVCVSEPGAKRVRGLSPAATLDEARRRARLTRDALSLRAQGTPLPVAALTDLEEILARTERGSVLSGSELAELGRLLDDAKTRRTYLAVHGADHPALRAALDTDRSLDRLRDEIAGAIAADGEVLDRASPALARARKNVSDTRRELSARMSELLTRYEGALRDRFYTEREGRYVLPVRADAPFRVDGIVFGSSSSGGTLYVEPREVTEIANRRYVAEAEVDREIARVLGAISISARTHVESLWVAFEAAVGADVLAALASWSFSASACVVEPVEEHVLELRAMRHPLLLGGKTDVVASDLRLDGARGLVISGPNAGGKTVALKCLGLASWMARAGIAVPADPASRIGFFDVVLSDIGDEQSLTRSLSTFSAHTARLASYLDEARPGTLVLLDEIAAGTDPDEGAALAAAVLEAFVDRGAAIAVTTHYERLKQLAAHDPRFENASVGFDFTAMRPTFRVAIGVPGASSALIVASRYGVPKAVITRAEALIPEDKLRRETLLADIEADRSRIASALREAEADRRQHAELTAALEDELRRAREQERARLAREGSELTAAVRDAREQLRIATARLRRPGGEGEIGRAELRELERVVNAAASEVAVGSKLETSLREDPKGAGAPIKNALRLAPGDTVYVPKLRAHAEVLEAPSRGQLRVAAGAMKLTLRLDEVGQSAPGAKPTFSAAKKPRRAPSPPRRDETPVRTDSITCDVRGLRVEEALDRVEGFIDRLLSEGDPAGFVLHGHGTNALKTRIREHVATHRFVAKARPGEPDEGGDAFTVVWTAD